MKKILFVISAAFLLSGCNRLDMHQPLTSISSKFSEGESISQTIYSNRANLNTVSVCLRNSKRELIPMTFTLNQGSNTIRTLDFSSGNIEEDDCTKFKFAPVLNSKNQTYTVTITSPSPRIDKLVPTILQVEKHEGIWHYKTFYYQPFREVLSESTTQFLSRLSLDIPFLTIWLIGVLFIVVKIFKSKS